jgi:hypothetical protein
MMSGLSRPSSTSFSMLAVLRKATPKLASTLLLIASTLFTSCNKHQPRCVTDRLHDAASQLLWQP